MAPLLTDSVASVSTMYSVTSTPVRQSDFQRELEESILFHDLEYV